MVALLVKLTSGVAEMDAKLGVSVKEGVNSVGGTVSSREIVDDGIGVLVSESKATEVESGSAVDTGSGVELSSRVVNTAELG